MPREQNSWAFETPKLNIKVKVAAYTNNNTPSQFGKQYLLGKMSDRLWSTLWIPSPVFSAVDVRPALQLVALSQMPMKGPTFDRGSVGWVLWFADDSCRLVSILAKITRFARLDDLVGRSVASGQFRDKISIDTGLLHCTHQRERSAYDPDIELYYRLESSGRAFVYLAHQLWRKSGKDISFRIHKWYLRTGYGEYRTLLRVIPAGLYSW